MPGMESLSRTMRIQRSMLAQMPPLTVNSRLPDITLGLTNWLMSVFIGSLPLETHGSDLGINARHGVPEQDHENPEVDVGTFQTDFMWSLNFITGMLLLFLPEEKAFWMLHIIAADYLPGTHEIFGLCRA
jgi:hypothetical protein